MHSQYVLCRMQITAVSVEILRSKILASKFSRLYYITGKEKIQCGGSFFYFSFFRLLFLSERNTIKVRKVRKVR